MNDNTLLMVFILAHLAFTSYLFVKNRLLSSFVDDCMELIDCLERTIQGNKGGLM